MLYTYICSQYLYWTVPNKKVETKIFWLDFWNETAGRGGRYTKKEKKLVSGPIKTSHLALIFIILPKFERLRCRNYPKMSLRRFPWSIWNKTGHFKSLQKNQFWNFLVDFLWFCHIIENGYRLMFTILTTLRIYGCLNLLKMRLEGCHASIYAFKTHFVQL